MTTLTQAPIDINDLQATLIKVMEHYEGVIHQDYFDNPTKWNEITGLGNQQVNHAIYTYLFNAPHDALMNVEQEQFDNRMEQARNDQEFWNVNQ